jgi:hypothetical protein
MKWVDIPGWESRYEISEHGDVRSKDMVVGAKSGATAIRKGRVLAKVRKTNDYLCVTLTDGINRPQIAIHRLVARAFIGEGPIGLHVLHNDGNKSNNHFTNLRYGTPAENIADTKRHGKQKFGSQHPHAKLDEDAVVTILTSTRPAREIAAWFGVTPAHISAVKRRRVWQHVQI